MTPLLRCTPSPDAWVRGYSNNIAVLLVAMFAGVAKGRVHQLESSYNMYLRLFLILIKYAYYRPVLDSIFVCHIVCRYNDTSASAHSLLHVYLYDHLIQPSRT